MVHRSTKIRSRYLVLRRWRLVLSLAIFLLLTLCHSPIIAYLHWQWPSVSKPSFFVIVVVVGFAWVWVLFPPWSNEPYRWDCPHCGARRASNELWRCGFCDYIVSQDLAAGDFSYLRCCPECSDVQHAVECPACRQQVALINGHSNGNVAKLIAKAELAALLATPEDKWAQLENHKQDCKNVIEVIQLATSVSEAQAKREAAERRIEQLRIRTPKPDAVAETVNRAVQKATTDARTILALKQAMQQTLESAQAMPEFSRMSSEEKEQVLQAIRDRFAPAEVLLQI